MNFSVSVFGMQIVVSAVVMTFSIVQLSRGMSSDIYLPILTSLTGYWLPQPRGPRSERSKYKPPVIEMTEVSRAEDQV